MVEQRKSNQQMVKRLNSEIGLHQLNLKKLLTKNGLLIPDISQAEKKSLFALVRILVVRNSNFLNVNFDSSHFWRNVIVSN